MTLSEIKIVPTSSMTQPESNRDHLLTCGFPLHQEKLDTMCYRVFPPSFLPRVSGAEVEIFDTGLASVSCYFDQGIVCRRMIVSESMMWWESSESISASFSTTSVDMSRHLSRAASSKPLWPPPTIRTIGFPFSNAEERLRASFHFP